MLPVVPRKELSNIGLHTVSNAEDKTGSNITSGRLDRPISSVEYHTDSLG
jgi:hypothetical protein